MVAVEAVLLSGRRWPVAAIRTMVSAPIPLRAARLSRSYRSAASREEASCEAQVAEVLRRAMAHENFEGAPWQRVGGDAVMHVYLGASRDGRRCILFYPDAAKAVWIDVNGRRRRIFYPYGSAPAGSQED